MANLTVQFYDKDYYELTLRGLDIEVTSLTREATVGDKEAKLRADGNELDLWQLMDLLRYPVKIFDMGACIWRGYIGSVMVQAATGLRITASIERVYNKVKASYVNAAAGESGGGDQAETSWYSNTDAIAWYGTKEKIIQLPESDSTQAPIQAQRVLSEFAWPTADRDLGNLGVNTSPYAEITLLGWFETLDWKYYTQTTGKESYEESGDSQNLGNITDQTKLEQSFQIVSTTAWTASQAALRIRKEGSPTDNLVIQVCADSSGAPGTVLASITIAGANVPENTEWVTSDLSAKVTLSPSTTYHLQLSRSGSIDASNYYTVDVNEDLGYTRGSFKIWNGSAWVARGTDADMLFKVLGVVQTSTQVSMIVTSCGQFLTATQIDQASGVYTNPYQDGSQTGLTIALELMRGSTTNYRRLQATIDDDRRVIITEEPQQGSSNYAIDRRGKLYDCYGNQVLPEMMPAGVWLELKELTPAQAQFIGFVSPTAIFVEEVTWNARGKLSWQFRGKGAWLKGVV